MRPLFAIALICGAIVACKPPPGSDVQGQKAPASDAKQPTATTAAMAISQPTARPQSGNQKPMELNALVPRGYTIVDTQKGDLNGDGIPDVLMLVEDSVNTSKVAGEGARRKLMILIGDQGGKYVVAATNDHIVPCATCGGIAGDPFAFIRIDDGGVFVIAMGGGSSDKWGDEATFKYSSEKKSWFAESYVNTVWEDGKDPKITKFQKAHGAAFSEFNPNDFQEKQPR